MKVLFLFMTTLIPVLSFSQTGEDQTALYSGYVLDEDSVPIGNAYLISFRTTKIVTTDSLGAFRIRLQKGDSLMVFHVSFKRKIVLADTLSKIRSLIVLQKEFHLIMEVTIRDQKQELINLEKNVQIMQANIRQPFNPFQLKRTGSVSVENPLSPQANNIDFAINLAEIIRRLRKK